MAQAPDKRNWQDHFFRFGDFLPVSWMRWVTRKLSNIHALDAVTTVINNEDGTWIGVNTEAFQKALSPWSCDYDDSANQITVGAIRDDGTQPVSAFIKIVDPQDDDEELVELSSATTISTSGWTLDTYIYAKVEYDTGTAAWKVTETSAVSAPIEGYGWLTLPIAEWVYNSGTPYIRQLITEPVQIMTQRPVLPEFSGVYHTTSSAGRVKILNGRVQVGTTITEVTGTTVALSPDIDVWVQVSIDHSSTTEEDTPSVTVTSTVQTGTIGAEYSESSGVHTFKHLIGKVSSGRYLPYHTGLINLTYLKDRRYLTWHDIQHDDETDMWQRRDITGWVPWMTVGEWYDYIEDTDGSQQGIGARDFAGEASQQYLSIAQAVYDVCALFATEDWAFSLWVHMDGPGEVIFGPVQNNPNLGVKCFINPSDELQIHHRISTGNSMEVTWNNGGAGVEAADWFHVLFCWNGSSQTLYVNGASVDTAADANAIPDNGYDFTLGSENQEDTPGNYFNGGLCRFGLWSDASVVDSAAAASHLYNGGAGRKWSEIDSGYQTSAVLYWDMDEQSGNAGDDSGNSRPGTDNNGVGGRAGPPNPQA